MKILTKSQILGEKPVSDVTFREALTAYALQGLLANSRNSVDSSRPVATARAADAVVFADAVLEKLTGEGE